jgi:hypothetical protein
MVLPEIIFVKSPPMLISIFLDHGLQLGKHVYSLLQKCLLIKCKFHYQQFFFEDFMARWQIRVVPIHGESNASCLGVSEIVWHNTVYV